MHILQQTLNYIILLDIIKKIGCQFSLIWYIREVKHAELNGSLTFDQISPLCTD